MPLYRLGQFANCQSVKTIGSLEKGGPEDSPALPGEPAGSGFGLADLCSDLG
jgi:hypothetical protein